MILFEGNSTDGRPGELALRQRGRRLHTFDIDIQPRGEGYIVRLAGDASILQAEEIEHRLTMLMVRRPALVVFDLQNLGYVSSLTLGLLVNFRRSLLRHGGRVRLAGVQQPVFEILTLAGLVNRFEIIGQVHEAFVA